MRQQAASVYFYGILLIFCILIVQSISQTISPGRTEKWENLMNGVLQNCVLETVDTNIATKVDKMAVDGAKVIYIDFNLYNFNESLIIQDQGSVYNPVSWVMTTGRHGQSLLLLRPQYEVFSLRSLSLGTERIEVSVKQTPMNCLADYNATVVSDALGEFLLHKFKTPSRNTSVSVETLKETDHICNLHIVPKNGKAIFHYMCCHKTLSGHTECQQLKSDKYLAVLFVCIFIVNFFAVMFSPLLIPSKCYQKKFDTTSYEHKLRKPVILTVRKTSAKSKEQYSFPVSYFEEMTEFNKTVESMGTDITYIVTVSKINIVTEMARLMPSNRVPVGLFESLYKALIDCEVRKKRSMEGCCESNIFGSCKPFNREYPWYKILKLIMHFLLYVLVGMIWFVRLYVYFKFEQSERLDRQNAASQRNLKLSYTGNLTWYLTPVHILFVTCYCIFVVDVILFGIISKQVKRTLKKVLRKCFRDMREISKTSAFGWSIQILLHPFKHCGVFGFLFAWLFYIPAIPVFIVTLSFYCFPTINVLVRLIIYFVAYLLPYGRNCLTERIAERLKQLWRYIHRVFQIDILTSQESIERPEKLSVKNKILQVIVIFSCLLTILSAVLLAMECIVFLAEIFMYTLIGIVINSSFTLKYLSLAFLLGFYARDCFNTVTVEYLTFNKFLNGYLVDKMRDEVEKISMQSHEDQRNTAFQVSLDGMEGQDDKPVSLTNEHDKLKWIINSLILFLDKNDTPYITSKFFFDTCYMEQAGVPGPLVSSLLRATQRFMLICIFLFFVVIVILAFGDEYGISATNQMFATLAGGFLPYILRWVLFKDPEPVTVDPNNLSFKSKFRRKIKEYKQLWEVSDIIVDRFKTKETEDDNEVKSTAAATDDENISQDEVIVLEENNSKDDTIMLEEINATVKDNTVRTVDLLIYDNFTV
ncbi:Hypothetical predicted protein [Mytilus galloprovincialis]|uniref:Uncharacterized protein n=1 Tax=Mytilus galloprovincialis TaxID=29158 RepID=A0A8B6GAI9_MYTGA|nr:Hypothetical predicted protein [Mytilus galloprovincialis]